MSDALSWLEAESSMVNFPRLFLCSHFKAQSANIWQHTSTCIGAISEIPFYQLVCFMDEFQNLDLQGKGNGPTLAMGLDPHLHIKAGCSGTYPDHRIREHRQGDSQVLPGQPV